MPEQPILHCRDLHLSFGGVVALRDISFEVTGGEIFAIIGPNGAGKTSALNCVSGLYRPSRGSITFAGSDITTVPPHLRARQGIARSFQNLALFDHMSVVDNVLVGRHLHMHAGPFTGGMFFGPARSEELRHRQTVEEVLEFLDLVDLRRRPVGVLSYGQRKRVEMARALAMEPRLLLLDEPMAGMNQAERDLMVRAILETNARRGITVLMIEHDMGIVMEISDTVCVLDFGRRIAIGRPAEVANDPHVVSAYLGEEDA